MTTAVVRLRAVEPSTLGGLAGELGVALNGPGNPYIHVDADDRDLAFTCETWPPILRVRVEDALNELLGSAWRADFERA